MKKRFAGILLSLAIAALTGCSSNASSNKESITIGSKNFTENIILAHLMADVIEDKTNLNVVRKVNLGGSNVAWKALLNNDIQLYPEYTGTIVANYYQEKTGTADETLQKARDLLKKDKLVFTNKFGFNNTYTLAVTQETAQKYNLKTFSDLAKVSGGLLLGCEFEFKDRPDGYPGLDKQYGMKFKEVKGMDHGIMYRSLTEKNVDVIDAYSTDGQIKVNHLTVLQDDKNFFPPYHAGPLVREDVLNKYPDVGKALNSLENKLNESVMQDLNAQVDMDGMKAEDVARNFLIKQGIIKK
ncbi:glycine/betaine ABC transporter substrate-binding protein [Gordoniibacillus kamchatkensis]|uniref:Glycine/betaine ABC transporter substrate-binding protein n=1 Tax=Gordoniibacillus kamchatkensis TaxID=1590651 RepID=A0ABR5AHF6_9BACL|nr:glycine betaine ABC transporter substrate-binding protein [Paenibacillus sp. VKM B-2647]KIL40484.1 glycine/betaine ABC transporter substrate-binding protein [Paenibacillus sp. VKM B-2647]